MRPCSSQPLSKPPFGKDGFSKHWTKHRPLKLPKRARHACRVLSPLERLEELGTRRFGVIFELEGIIVPSCAKADREEWQQIAREEGLEQPAEYQLRAALRKKTDHAVSRVFNWASEPQQVRFLTQRKSALFCKRTETTDHRAHEHVLAFLRLLDGFDVPCAIYSSQLSSEELTVLLRRLQLTGYFKTESVIGRDDVQSGLPDTEYYLVAARALFRPISKCIVISDHHLAIEATTEIGMKCVIVNSTDSTWELSGANMVVPSLEWISFRNLQNIFSLDVYES